MSASGAASSPAWKQPNEAVRRSSSRSPKLVVDHPFKAKIFSAFLILKDLAADQIPSLVGTILKKYNSLHSASPQSGRLLLAFTNEEHRNTLLKTSLTFGLKTFQAKSLEQIRVRLYNLPLAITKQVASDFLLPLGVVHNVQLDTYKNTTVLNGNATAWITPKNGVFPEHIHMLDRRVRVSLSRSDPSSTQAKMSHITPLVQSNRSSDIPSSNDTVSPSNSTSPSSNLRAPCSLASPANAIHPNLQQFSSQVSTSSSAPAPLDLPEQLPLPPSPSSIPTSSSSIETPSANFYAQNVGISSSFSSSPSCRSIRRRPCRLFGTWAVSSATISLANRFDLLHEKVHGDH